MTDEEIAIIRERLVRLETKMNFIAASTLVTAVATASLLVAIISSHIH